METKKTAVAILIILILSVGGYFVWKNYSKPIANPGSNNPTQDEEDARMKMIGRDTKRLEDLSRIGIALNEYAGAQGGRYPETNGVEKISDEKSSAFQALKAGAYLEEPIKDPLPEHYYGYQSDGKKFELTAVLEDKTNDGCEFSGELCILRISVVGDHLYREKNLEEYLDEE